MLLANLAQSCPPKASLENCAACCAFLYIIAWVSPGCTDLFNAVRKVLSLAWVNTLSQVILSNHLNTFSTFSAGETPKCLFQNLSTEVLCKPLKL